MPAHNICRLSVDKAHICAVWRCSVEPVRNQCQCFFFLTNGGGPSGRFQPTRIYSMYPLRRCTCQGHCSQHCFWRGGDDSQVVSLHVACVDVSLRNCHHPKIRSFFQRGRAVPPVLLPHEEGFQAGDFLVPHLPGPESSDLFTGLPASSC